MQKKKIFVITKFVFTALLTVLFLSCGGGRNEGFRYGFTSEPSTFDPLSPAGTADGRSILFNVFEGLVKPDTAGRMQPCIAESWTIEQGALVYNFFIREGVRFHDGSILTPADVKFSLDTAVAANYNGLNRIKITTITGENQLTVTLESPDPDFLPYLTIGIVKAGNTNREKDIIGTGPFFIESYKAQNNLVLRKFDGYWKTGVPYLDKVTIVFFANNDAQVVALNGGRIDGASLTASMTAQLDHRKFDFHDSYSAAVQLLALNNAVEPLDDLRVRLALNYGIDVQGIIDAAFFGLGSPSGSPIIPGLSAYYERDLSYPYDTDLARRFLAEAGFGEGGKKFSLEITVPSNFTMHVDTAVVIVDQLAKAGVEASIKLVDWATWLNDVYYGRNYMATIISLDSPVVSPGSFLARYHSESGSNFVNFNNSEFDAIYDMLSTEIDEARRTVHYREAQGVISANAASVYLQDILYFKVLRKNSFGGVLNYPLYVVDFASIYGIDGN